MAFIRKMLRPIWHLFLKIRKHVLALIPLKPYIFFESVPDFSDNARFVFDEMIRRGWNKKYKMFWAINNPPPKIDIENTYFVKKETREWRRLTYCSKVLISCNYVFYKAVPRKDQLYYHLCHGVAYIKNCGRNIFKSDNYINYINTLSDYQKEVELNTYGRKECDFTYFGFPRNDIFFQKDKLDLHKVFPCSDFEKCIVWLPTFRQNIKGTRIYSSISLPVIHTEEDAISLNNYAKDSKVLIVLKPHFNQSMEKIKKLNFGNLLIIDDSYFEKQNLILYQVLANSDALITDYSSVFWDYLNRNRPIGMCWEDYDEFEEKNGFNIDMEPVRQASELVNSLSNFYTFIDNIKNGKDIKKEKREHLNALVNPTADGTTSKKIVDFIEQELQKL